MYSSPKVDYCPDLDIDINLLNKVRSNTTTKLPTLYAPKFKQKLAIITPSPIKKSKNKNLVLCDFGLSAEEDNDQEDPKNVVELYEDNHYKKLEDYEDSDDISETRSSMKKMRLFSNCTEYSKDDSNVKYFNILKNIKIDSNPRFNRQLSKTVKFNCRKEIEFPHFNDKIDVNIGKTYGLFKNFSRSLTYWGLQKKKNSSILGCMQVNRYLRNSDAHVKNMY